MISRKAEYETTRLAEQVVALLDRGSLTAAQEARDLVSTYYAGNPVMVVRAYELACLISIKNVEKRIRRERKATVITPEGDLLAMNATYLAIMRYPQKSFELLRQAVERGASQPLCRKAAIALISELPESHTLSILAYTSRTILSLEIGVVPQRGFVLLGQTEDKNISASIDRNRNERERSKVFVRTNQELIADSAGGFISSDRVGVAPIALHRIDWFKYFLNVSGRPDKRRVA